MNARPCTMPCGTWRRSGQTSPAPIQAMRGAAGLRELRPRRGSSPWRAIYRRVGGYFVIAAVGPDGGKDPRGFRQACERALQRLAELDEE